MMITPFTKKETNSIPQKIYKIKKENKENSF